MVRATNEAVMYPSPAHASTTMLPRSPPPPSARMPTPTRPPMEDATVPAVGESAFAVTSPEGSTV